MCSASAIAPSAMSFTYCPDANSPPPVLTCKMPSHFASANAASAALIVLVEVMLIAGYANLCVLAWASMRQYVA
jgi:hypothetical protein